MARSNFDCKYVESGECPDDNDYNKLIKEDINKIDIGFLERLADQREELCATGGYKCSIKEKLDKERELTGLGGLPH